MWRSKRYSAAAVLCALAFACLCCDLSAQAMPSFFKKQSASRKRTDAPTVVEAATMDIDMENNVATLLGNVVVDDQDVKITCDKMIIYLEDKTEAPEEEGKDKSKKQTAEAAKASSRTAAEEDDPAGGKQLKRIECYGEVVITHRADPKDTTQKEQVATSDYAVYDVAAGTITLTGRPVLTSGTDRLDAEKIVFEVDTGRTLITTGKGTYYGDTPLSSGAAGGKKKK